jgi:hypothetical protein
VQSKLVVEKYYDEFVKPFFEDESDLDDYDGGDLETSLPGSENDGNWEDISDEELDNAMSVGSVDNSARDEAVLLFHTMMTDAFGPLPGMGYYDNEDEDADADADMMDAMLEDMLGLDVENMDEYDDMDLSMGLPPLMMGPIPFVDIESDDEIPELGSQ